MGNSHQQEEQKQVCVDGELKDNHIFIGNRVTKKIICSPYAHLSGEFGFGV